MFNWLTFWNVLLSAHRISASVIMGVFAHIMWEWWGHSGLENPQWSKIPKICDSIESLLSAPTYFDFMFWFLLFPTNVQSIECSIDRIQSGFRYISKLIGRSSRFMTKGLKTNVNAKLSLLFWGSDSDDRIIEIVNFSLKKELNVRKVVCSECSDWTVCGHMVGLLLTY